MLLLSLLAAPAAGADRDPDYDAILDAYKAKRHADVERLAGRDCALGYKLVRKIAEVLCQRVRQGNQDILKLTTALSIALSK